MSEHATPPPLDGDQGKLIGHLVIQVKIGERIQIGPDIAVELRAFRRGQRARVSVYAPQAFKISRGPASRLEGPES